RRTRRAALYETAPSDFESLPPHPTNPHEVPRAGRSESEQVPSRHRAPGRQPHDATFERWSRRAVVLPVWSEKGLIASRRCFTDASRALGRRDRHDLGDQCLVRPRGNIERQLVETTVSAHVDPARSLHHERIALLVENARENVI